MRQCGEAVLYAAGGICMIVHRCTTFRLCVRVSTRCNSVTGSVTAAGMMWSDITCLAWQPIGLQAVVVQHLAQLSSQANTRWPMSVLSQCSGIPSWPMQQSGCYDRANLQSPYVSGCELAMYRVHTASRVQRARFVTTFLPKP